MDWLTNLGRRGASGDEADTKWGDERASNLTLQLVTPPLPPPAAHPAPSLHASAAPQSSVFSYHLHSAVLLKSTSYFQDKMAGAGSGAAATHDGAGGAAGQPLLLVEHVGANEVPAAKAVLRFCYTRQLWPAGGAASDNDLLRLLRIVALAARFGVRDCITAGLKEVCARGSRGVGPLTCNWFYEVQPLSVSTHALFPRAKQPAAQWLHRFLGDAEEVCSTWYATAPTPANYYNRLDALQELSLPCLLALLSSDQLRARSENSVLLMADAWVADPSGAACSLAEHRSVADALRLGQLTRSFVLDVLPELDWLQLTPVELAALVRFAAAGPSDWAPLTQHSDVQACLVKWHRQPQNQPRLCGPASWYTTTPRVPYVTPVLLPAPPSAFMPLRWDVSAAELQQHLSAVRSHGTQELRSPQYFCNGFSAQLLLRTGVRPEALPGAPPSSFLALEVTVRPQGRAERDIDMKQVTIVMAAGSMDVLSRGVGRRHLDYSPSFKLIELECFPKVPLPQLLDAASWQEYLTGGRLRSQYVIYRLE